MGVHTPAPWRVEADEKGGEIQGYDIRTDSEEIVGQEGILGGPIGEANAAFIVRAVNAHEALVDALRGALYWNRERPQLWMDAARSAISLADPEP